MHPSVIGALAGAAIGFFFSQDKKDGESDKKDLQDSKKRANNKKDGDKPDDKPDNKET